MAHRLSAIDFILGLFLVQLTRVISTIIHPMVVFLFQYDIRGIQCVLNSVDHDECKNQQHNPEVMKYF